MKAVLLSIRPEWCKLIWAGMKTVEVRKTKPEGLKPPFKCYIYCTLAGSDSLFMDVLNRDVAAWNRDGWPEKKGLVIGEFTCDGIENVVFPYPAYQNKLDPKLILKSGMSYIQLHRYASSGKTRDDLFFWHISDLKIYNQPKDIMCFHRAVEENELWCKKCAIGKKKDVHCAFCYGLDGLRLRRPPQSWCYVEELSSE